MQDTAANHLLKPALIVAIQPMKIFSFVQNAEENFEVILIQIPYDFSLTVTSPSPEILSLYPGRDTG